MERRWLKGAGWPPKLTVEVLWGEKQQAGVENSGDFNRTTHHLLIGRGAVW